VSQLRCFVCAALITAAMGLVGFGSSPSAAAQTQTVPQASFKYVAMGDSYSAGEGAPPFLPSRIQTPDACHQSQGAYPVLLASSLGLQNEPRFTFLACSGAKIDNLLTVGQHPGMLPQNLKSLRDADLLTVGVGGNDAGFADVLTDCAFHDHCQDRYTFDGRDLVSALIQGERPRLESLYRTLLARTRDGLLNTAPLYVVGYPLIFPLATSRVTCLSTLVQLGYDGEEFNWIRNRTKELNSVIRSAAVAAGAHYIDTENAFAGHLVCDEDPWANGISIPTEYSFHPNIAGQRRLFELVSGEARAISPSALVPGLMGSRYSQAVQMVGTPANFEWSIEDVTGAAWMSIDPNSGVITGMPQAGLTRLTVRAQSRADNSTLTRRYELRSLVPCQPGPPIDVLLDRSGNTLVASWTPSIITGSTSVRQYEITLVNRTTGETKVFRVDGTSFVFPDNIVQPGQEFQVRVVAINAGCRSPSSSSSNTLRERSPTNVVMNIGTTGPGCDTVIDPTSFWFWGGFNGFTPEIYITWRHVAPWPGHPDRIYGETTGPWLWSPGTYSYIYPATVGSSGARPGTTFEYSLSSPLGSASAIIQGGSCVHLRIPITDQRN
jgi:lysophospholipase L1-like esterase